VNVQLRFAATATFLFLFGCALPRPVVPPTGPIALALVTWNLNAGRGDVGRLVDDLAAGRLTDAPVSDYVLLLQEAVEGGDRDIAAFARGRSLDAHFTPIRRSPARTTGNAILSTRPLEHARVVALPRERQPRAAVAAIITVAGQRLSVASVHLENRLTWWRLALFADNARGRQAAALIAALPPGPGIVGRDMNTILGPHDPAWRTLLARYPDTPARPGPTFRERLVLDHLFFDLPDGWRATRTVLTDRYWSDHRPVLGVIRRER